MTRERTYAGGIGIRYLLIGSTVALTLIGLVMVYSASSVSALVRLDDSTYFLMRQLVGVGLGVVALVVLSRLDYRKLRYLAIPGWGIGVGLLLLVALAGVVRGGAQRWVEFGPLGTLQPSEYVKVVSVFLVAALVAEFRRGRIDERQLMVRTALFVGVAAGLVFAQRDLGTTLVIVVSAVVVLFLGGISIRSLGVAAACIGALGAIGIALEPYRMARLVAFLNPGADPLDDGYQTLQALLAFGTGGVDGIGLGLSRQKFFYLPEAHTDFILAIIGEEAGLLGTLAVVLLFGAFAYAGVRIALGCRDAFGRMLAGGLTGMIAIQALMNMGAVTSLMPVTGKPLPFVSYGGSSMLFTLACVGLILSVSRYGASELKAQPRTRSDEEPTIAIASERRRDGRAHLSGPGGGRGTARRGATSRESAHRNAVNRENVRRESARRGA